MIFLSLCSSLTEEAGTSVKLFFLELLGQGICSLKSL
jgi:hypothetical protein